jgi:hypothetical protein
VTASTRGANSSKRFDVSRCGEPPFADVKISGSPSKPCHAMRLPAPIVGFWSDAPSPAADRLRTALPS